MKKTQLRVFFFATLAIAFFLTLTASAEILNPGFELGSYTNWTSVSGTAFGQPASTAAWTLTSWEGTYYANSVYPDGNPPADELVVGVLRSDTFTYPTNYALSFLIGGASIHWGYTNTYITLNLASDDTELARELTPENPVMEKKYFDVPAAYDQEVYIEVVDNGTNAGWSWIAVDDFKFESLDTQNFDFENGYKSWVTTGSAWGTGPKTVDFWPAAHVGFDCHETYYALSLTGGEAATGTIKSVDFAYPTDGVVKFLVCGHSTHFPPAIYNYVALKDANDDTEYGRVYAPNNNHFIEMAITNSAANGKQVYIEGVDDCTEAGWAWLGLDYIHLEVAQPDTPKGVSATKGSTNDRVIVTWFYDAKATKYIVYRNTVDDTNTTSDISGELGAVNQFDDTTAIDNSNYYYWVRAGNSYGWSPLSDYAIGFRTTSTGPDKPSNVLPVSGAEPDFPIFLVASAYSDSSGWPFVTSEWQISSSVTFSPRMKILAGAVTNIAPSNGDFYSGTNYWKVRYGNDKNKWSEWSDTTLFIVNRDMDSPFYFYETFNNVSGSGDVNKEYYVTGRQLGMIAALNYSTLGTTETGMSADAPNKLKLTGVAACSPNESFEEFGNFKIECDIEPDALGTAITFGKMSQNAPPDSVGGMGFVFYGDGSGTYKVYDGDTLLGTFINDEIKSPPFHFRATVLTEDFTYENADIAVFVNGEPLMLWNSPWAQPFRTNHYNYVYQKGSGFEDNYITLYNLGGEGFFDNLEIQMSPDNNLNVFHWANDADSGIKSSYNYTHAVNLNYEGDIIIEGVTFTGSGTGHVNYSALGGSNTYLENGNVCITSNNWELRTADGLLEIDNEYWNMPTPDVTGSGEDLLTHMAFDSHDGIQIRLNVTPGSSNVFAMHFFSWWGAGFAFPVSGNDGSTPGPAPIDYEALKCSVLEYEYQAPDNGEFIFTLSIASHPIFSFSNYETTTAEPELYTIASLDFGEAVAGQAKTFKLPVFNFGAGTVSGIVTGADLQFELRSGSNYSAQSESPDFVNISFTPTAEDEYSNVVFLTGSGGSVQVELKGIGVPEPGTFGLLAILGLAFFRRK